MPADDDELRAQLVRERAGRSQAVRAGEVLTELRPAMHTAKRRRLAVTAAAATMSFGGLVVAAQVVRTAPDNSIRTSSSSERIDSPTSTAEVIPLSTKIEAVGIDQLETTTTSDTDAQRDESPATAEPSPDLEAVVPPETSTSAPRRGDTGSAPLPVTVTSTVPVPAPTSTIARQPSTSTTTPPSTTPAAGGPERFDSSCGYAWAIRSATSVELTEVVPRPGYQYRLEDPDEHGITIQFTGTGEDCALRIPTIGGGSTDN